MVASGSGAARTFVNKAGRASATIVTRDRTFHAALAPGQVYVFYDVARGFLGFGSAARVVEPSDLAEALLDELRRAAARYAR